MPLNFGLQLVRSAPAKYYILELDLIMPKSLTKPKHFLNEHIHQ